MRKNFGAKTWLYPMPVLIVGTYDENGTPNAMNAAWGGVYDMGQVMVCLSDDHKTTDNIKKTGAFTVSFATAKTVVPCDYVGIVSANDVPDKFARAGFHAQKSEHVNAPIIEELPMSSINSTRTASASARSSTSPLTRASLTKTAKSMRKSSSRLCTTV